MDDDRIKVEVMSGWEPLTDDGEVENLRRACAALIKVVRPEFPEDWSLRQMADHIDFGERATPEELDALDWLESQNRDG